MQNYNEVDGNLISLALKGEFDVIVHGCNCWNRMGSGLAPQMAKAFGCDTFKLEKEEHRGDINKLGQIDYESFVLADGQSYRYSQETDLYVVNAYTQFYYGKYHEGGIDKPVDYDAITLVMRKLNHVFKRRHIGLPYVIGCGLAGGNKDIVIPIIQRELKDCDVSLVRLPE